MSSARARSSPGIVRGWGIPAERISVLPNPTPPLPELPERVHGERPLLVFAGRMTAPKALGVALDAVAEVPEVDFELAGDGDERAALEARARELGLDGRVRFLGPLSRDEVLALFRRADAALLSSAWENFPHTLVEALAVGTPAIATVGRRRPRDRHARRERPARPRPATRGRWPRRSGGSSPTARCASVTAERPSAERFSAERIYGRLEEILVGAAADMSEPFVVHLEDENAVVAVVNVALTTWGLYLDRRRKPALGAVDKPRVLIVGRSRYRLPLEPNLRRKFDALAAELDVRVLASARDGSPTHDETFRLVPPREHARRAAVLGRAALPRLARAGGVPARTPCSSRARTRRPPCSSRAGASR